MQTRDKLGSPLETQESAGKAGPSRRPEHRAPQEQLPQKASAQTKLRKPGGAVPTAAELHSGGPSEGRPRGVRPG